MQGLRAVDNHSARATGCRQIAAAVVANWGDAVASPRNAWRRGCGRSRGRGVVGRAGRRPGRPGATVARSISAAAECADPVSETRHGVLLVELSTGLRSHAYRRFRRGGVDPAAIPMAEAEFISFRWQRRKRIKRYSTRPPALGATEGASAVAVDDGSTARDRQVTPAAPGSLRVWPSGSRSTWARHRCHKVVAINPGCDMIKRADLSVIGESAAILHALIAGGS